MNYKQNNNEKDKNKSENENEKENQIINSSYHKKSVKYQPNNYFETSFKEDKLYNIIWNKVKSSINVSKENNKENESAKPNPIIENIKSRYILIIIKRRN